MAPEILPDNGDEALARFKELLDQQTAKKISLLVVLGKGSAKELLSDDADDAADGTLQRVVWAQTPSHIASAIQLLGQCPRVPMPDLLKPDQAFVISRTNKITDVILFGESQPNYVRIMNVFGSAWEDC